jgi:hypothetical protein
VFISHVPSATGEREAPSVSTCAGMSAGRSMPMPWSASTRQSPSPVRIQTVAYQPWPSGRLPASSAVEVQAPTV